MSNPYVGQLGAVGVAKESVLGTFVAPTRFIPTYLPMNIGSPDINLLLSKGVRSVPDFVYKAQQGAGMLKNGKFKFEVEPENIGECLMASFGTDTLTGPTNTSVYTHTFTRLAAAQLPTYSIWVKNGLNYPTFVGCMVNKIDFDIKAGEWVITDVDWMGSAYASGGVTESLSYSTLNPFKFDQAVITVAGSGVSLYKDIKLSIDNKVKVDPVLGGSIYSNVIFSEAMEVTLSATIVVENSTEWAKFIAGTASSFTIALTSAQNITSSSPSTPYSLTFTIPNIYYKAAPLPLANGLIEITFQAQGVYNTGTSNTISVALANSISTSY